MQLQEAQEAARRHRIELEAAAKAQEELFQRKAQDWERKLAEVEKAARDVEAREAALNVLERRLGTIEVRESELRARSVELAEMEQRNAVSFSRVSEMGVSHRLLDADVSNHSREGFHRTPEPSALPVPYDSPVDTSMGKVTVDVVGNAASNVFRGIVLSRQQCRSLLDQVSEDSPIAAELRKEYADVGHSLESARASLFSLHEQVQRVLESSDASVSMEGQSQINDLHVQLDQLLNTLLGLQQRQSRWEARLGSVSRQSQPKVSAAGPLQAMEDHSSLYDTPVRQRWPDGATRRPAVSPGPQVTDWADTLDVLGIPKTPKH